MASKKIVAKDIFNKKSLICIFTGFTSELPLFILISLLPAWLRSSGLDLKAIGLFALIQFPFTWKFLWAPLFDRLYHDPRALDSLILAASLIQTALKQPLMRYLPLIF